ncbi:MAG: hypothetical protein U9P10_15040 [Thermodesulfobacteriota bacterium]|nr:hypothetical protein [Thermodesulfobacteriota bacterium]
MDNHLKYMAFAGDRPVACIGWGSAAWAVASRENFITGPCQRVQAGRPACTAASSGSRGHSTSKQVHPLGS